MLEQLDFGARAIYIWGSYGIVTCVLLALCIYIVSRERHFARLAQHVRSAQEGETGGKGETGASDE